MKNGIGLSGFIFLILLTLKLIPSTTVYHWSWWWVTCPLWISLAIGIIALIALVLIQTAERKKRKSFSSSKVSKFQQRLEEAQRKRAEQLKDRDNG